MDKQQDQPPRKINISEVFKKYQGQLKSFIAKRVTAQEDREDILQDVFYQLLKTDPVAPRTPIWMEVAAGLTMTARA